jgi:ATP-dependent helicase/nuclease subunit B
MAETIAAGHGGPVFTIAPGRPFLDALAVAVLSGHLPRPGGTPPSHLALASWTILLPTRRAARALQEAFLRASGADALLLPAIRPIAEGQEDLGLIQAAADPWTASPEAAEVPPAIESLERLLLLTRLVQAWAAAQETPTAVDPDEGGLAPTPTIAARSPAQAARLAAELARLVDLVETEGASLDGLEKLVPEAFAQHWQQTLAFLRIITEWWPAQLAELGLVSPADRRNRLILAEARRLAAHPPTAPVIVAGVTGSVPATAELMRAVARLPQGAIVLPGLDRSLEAERFAELGTKHPEHPQHGLARLLGALGIPREAVTELPGPVLPAPRATRNRIVAEAMRPPGSMSAWRRLAAELPADAVRGALTGLSLVETQSAEDEAEVVALVLREALETPGRTAALVSPDRLLARRVAIRLETWGIRVDDSAGRPFAKTVPGTFLALIAEAMRSGFAPAPVMALLKHPLTRLRLPAGDVRRRARNLEIAAFRTTYLGSGIEGLATTLARAEAEVAAGQRRGRAVSLLSTADWAEAADLVDRLRAAFQPLLAMPGDALHALGALVAAHVAVAEAVACPAETSDAESSPLWSRDEGEAAVLLLARLMAPEAPQPDVHLRDFPELLRALVGSESIRTRVPVHPRLSIWGPYEARLQQPDIVVLGGLNEGVWPKAADPGPWLNRSMRAALGLPSPEEEIGRAAHDLTQLLGAERVVMTRPEKSGGVPMVKSRWLLRLEALLAGLGAEDALALDRPWVAWARDRDSATRRPPLAAPAPRPALHLRPRRLSVSAVESWIANPYAIFASHILRLDALPALGREPGPSERGQIVHETLARFTRAFPDALPADVVGPFMAEADQLLGALGAEPKVKAFWRPRLQRFAEWLAETEPARRQPGSRRLVEVSGRLDLDAPGGPFTLTARADRIDIEGAELVITDYKTGTVPTARSVAEGWSPQLSLEAAMAAAGAFTGVAAAPVHELRYIRATGGEPAGEERTIAPPGTTVADMAAKALRDLEALIAAFDDPGTPYRAVRRRRFEAAYAYDDFAHLARIGEWGAADAGEDG